MLCDSSISKIVLLTVCAFGGVPAKVVCLI